MYSANPTNIIENNGGDLAEKLAGKQHITIELAPVTITHIGVDGQEKTVDATEITNSTTTLSAGWYVVNGSDVQTGSLVCEGAVNLILADGAKLTATGNEIQAGIQVSGTGNSLTIYGQTNQTGQLIAIGNAGAGIGGNGEGNDGSNITINGGIVKARSLYGGAGIGGGAFGNGYNITINGGTVTAIGYETSGIGGGQNGSGSNIKVATTLQVKAGATESTTTVVENTGSDLASSLDGKQYVVIEPVPYASYIDADGVEKIAKNVTEITDAFTQSIWGDTGKTTWYVVTGTDVNFKHGAICNGDVRLILADGAKLTATGANAGILVSGEGNSLTIYGQTAQTGELFATGGSNAAGIGGDWMASVSNITINGGDVTATGGEDAAGIGGGDSGSVSNITINGGTVIASGRGGGAGIGGGTNGSGSYITINGGTVKANGNDGGAGIGGGYKGSGSNITINGGIITATGGTSGAGIGGGTFGNGYNITINGGHVEATGGKSAAGIGGGDGGSGSNITITGGSVTANSSGMASGIGGGNAGTGSNITINVTNRIKADEKNPPVTLIHNDGTDLASSLADKLYVLVYPDPYWNERTAAYAAINAAIEGIAEEHILATAATAKENIFITDNAKDIDAALADLQILIAIYNSGKAAGLGSLAEPCDGCHAVEVKKGTTVVTLYAPDEVKFKKTEAAEE